MLSFNQGEFRQQARFLRHQFLQDNELPFSNVLSEDAIAPSLTAINTCWLDRIYSPLVTLWVFWGQVRSADHSCRAAVARLIAHRLSQGQRPCSAETGAYCQARKRLPEGFFSDVARRTGRALESNVDRQWLWKAPVLPPLALVGGKRLIEHPRQPHPRLIQPPPRNRKIRLRAGIRKLLAGLQHRSECIGPGVARPSTRRPASFVTWHAIDS
jgi:hypothetical protein